MVIGDSVPDVSSVRDTSWLSEAVHRQSLPVTGCLLSPLVVKLALHAGHTSSRTDDLADSDDEGLR